MTLLMILWVAPTSSLITKCRMGLSGRQKWSTLRTVGYRFGRVYVLFLNFAFQKPYEDLQEIQEEFGSPNLVPF